VKRLKKGDNVLEEDESMISDSLEGQDKFEEEKGGGGDKHHHPYPSVIPSTPNISSKDKLY